MKIGVVVFPGSNCDHDCQHVFRDVLGQYGMITDAECFSRLD